MQGCPLMVFLPCTTDAISLVMCISCGCPVSTGFSQLARPGLMRSLLSDRRRIGLECREIPKNITLYTYYVFI